MNVTHPSTLDRLMALAAEAEHALANGIGSHDIRHACAVARGYLELAADHGEPIRVEDVERILNRLRAALATVLPSRGPDKPRSRIHRNSSVICVRR